MNTVPTFNYSEILESACAVLDLSLTTIQKKYEGKILRMANPENEELNDVIEVKFKKEKIILYCYFNDAKVCNGSFLFFKNKDTIREIIKFLNESYNYDFINSRWELPECYVTINAGETEPHIIIYKEDQM